MLSEIFYWLFNMSIVATLSVIAILLLRMIRAIPRRVIKILWVIPFIRFWVPFGLSGKYGIMTLISGFTTKTVTVYKISENKAFTMTNGIMGANGYFPITYKVNLLETVFTVSSYIWLTVCIIILSAVIVLYVITNSEVKAATPYSGKNICLSDKIISPAVFGITKPRILLPTSYVGTDRENLEYVLMHECAHIRSCDNFLRMLAVITAAVHWFNPFVWIFLKCFLSDIEYACDEKVLSRVGEKERKKYAEALVCCAEEHAVFVSAFGGAKLHKRIERILSFRKISAASAVLFTFFVSVVTYILLTNAQ